MDNYKPKMVETPALKNNQGFLSELEKYIFFNNPYLSYSPEKIIKDKRVLLTEKEFVEEVLGEHYPSGSNVLNKIKFIGKSPYFKMKMYPNPNGLLSERIFGTYRKICTCGYTRINSQKNECPKCGAVYKPLSEQYLSIGYINLIYPSINPRFKSKFGSIFFKDRNLFKSILSHTSKLGYRLVLWNKEKKIFESNSKIEKAIKILYSYTSNFLSENGTLKLDQLVPELLKQAVNHRLITKKDAEEIKEKYLIEKPVFGIFTLILTILSEDEIFEKLITSDKMEITEKIYSILLILPVFSTHLRPLAVVNDKPTIGQLNTKLKELVLKYELAMKAELNLSPFPIEDQMGFSIEELAEEIVHDLFNVVKPFINHSMLEEYTEYARNGIFALKDYAERYVNSYMFKSQDVSEIVLQEYATYSQQKIVDEYYSFIDEKIRGKEGIVRQHIIGKTIDFSGRSVITPTLRVKPYEVLIPYRMAMELYKVEFLYFLIKLRDLITENKFVPDLTIRKITLPKDIDLTQYVKIKYKDVGRYISHIISVISSELEFQVKSKNPERDKQLRKDIEFLFDIFAFNVNRGNIWLTGFINRQPTLWIYSIIPYNIKINTDDKNDLTIKIHPLVVESFNADFDGDSIGNCNVQIEIFEEDKNEFIPLDVWFD